MRKRRNGVEQMAAKMRLGLEVVEGEFGRNVRALRAHLGLSDNELAAKLGVSGGAVRNWESGSSVPTEDHIAHLIRMAGG